MRYGTQEWHPFCYDQIHVGCAVVKKVPTGFESVIVPYREVKCHGYLWYRWDENNKSVIDTACDKCLASFHCDQLEMF